MTARPAPRRFRSSFLSRDETSDSFLFQVLSGVSADMTVAVTTFALALVTARVLGPHNRGVYGLTTFGAALLGVVADFGLPTAVMTFAVRAEAPLKQLHGAGAIYTGLLAAALAIVLYAGHTVLDHGPLRGMPPTLLPLLGVAAAFNMYNRLAISLLTALRMIRSSAVLRVATVGVAAAATGFCLIIFGGTATSAVLIAFAAQAGSMAVAAAMLIHRGIGVAIPGRSLWHELFRFGGKSQAGNISRQAFLRLDYYFVNWYTGTAAAGVYSVAVALAEGLWLVVGSVYRALVPRLGDAGERTTLELTARVFRVMVCASAIVVGLCVGVAPWLIPWLFGHAYEGAVVPFMILVCGVAALGLYYVLSAYVLVHRKRPVVNSLIEGSTMLGSVVLYWALIRPYGIRGAALGSTITYCGLLFGMVAYFVHHVGRRRVQLIPSLEDWRSLMRTVVHPRRGHGGVARGSSVPGDV